MKRWTAFCLALVIVLVIAAGCTGREPVPAPATSVPTPSATAPGPVSVTPEPTDHVPTQYRVELQVDRNTVSIDPSIIVTFRGGNGAALLASLDVIVTRSDGVVKT